MALNREKLANFLEYFGVSSSNYFLSRVTATAELEDPLAYYLDMSPRAVYDGPVDEVGLPIYAPLGGLHLPVLILNWALGHLERYRQTRTEIHLSACRRAADWLVDSQAEDGAWMNPGGMPKYGLKGPFRSAMTQGLAISLLARMNRLVEHDRYMSAAIDGLKPFTQPVADGGVTTYHDEGPFFEEYPCDPPHHVLNGALFAMFGLWDLAEAGESSEARALWYQGLATLIAWLPRFDLGYWSLYHLPATPPNPATIKYHELHVDQLRVLHAVTGDQTFATYADRWAGYRRRRLNALRTLPSKLRWHVRSGRQPSTRTLV